MLERRGSSLLNQYKKKGLLNNNGAEIRWMPTGKEAVGSPAYTYPVWMCNAQITTPVDSTITIPYFEQYCSSGGIEVDSVAAGNGIVVINGSWRLT
jgi:hypothetical protein